MSARWRRLAVPLAAVVGIAMAFYVRGMLVESERRLDDFRFHLDADSVVRSIEREFVAGEESVQALQAFFKGSTTVTEKEFGDFTGLLLESHPEVDAFLWVEQRGGAFVPTYVRTQEWSAAPGDITADAAIAAAMEQALGHHEAVCAPSRGGKFFLVGQARSEQEHGIVATRIDIGRAVAEARLHDKHIIDLSIYDAEGDGTTLVYGEPGHAGEAEPVTFTLAGRTMEVYPRPGNGYPRERASGAPTAVLLSLIAATVLAVGYALTIAGRTARIERVVAERTATIREVTRLQRAILESAPYAILSFDPIGRVLSLNPAAEHLVGCNAAQAVGALGLGDFLDRAELEARAPSAGRAGGALLALAQRDADDAWTLTRRDGTRVPVRLTVSVLRRESGEVAGFLAIAHDITARLAAEAELKEAKAQAEEASRLKSRFLANMSHEFRTPLTAILGYAEMLEEDARAEGKAGAADDCRRIQKAGRHLLRLIDEILDLAKIESGRIELQIEEVELEGLVEEVEATVRRLVEEKGNRLEVRGATGETVRADALRLKQVLFNLVANAARFTEKGTITLETTREGDAVVLRVRDTGIGMTAEELERVFQPFVQADGSTTRRYGGTGLGLAIAQQFAEMMGGALTATSEPGAGSEFVVRLPA